jgi:hypothetical protein
LEFVLPYRLFDLIIKPGLSAIEPTNKYILKTCTFNFPRK